jgi:hypothetical protein
LTVALSLIEKIYVGNDVGRKLILAGEVGFAK